MIKVESFVAFILLSVYVQAYSPNLGRYNKRQDRPTYVEVAFPGIKAPPSAPRSCGLFGKDDVGMALNYGVDESKLLPNEILSVPYQVMIGGDHAGTMTWFCAGLLINDLWVLAAAHCSTEHTELTTLRFGEKDVENPSEFPNMNPVDIGILKVIIHPDYKMTHLLSNDLALIRMATTLSPYRFDIRPICLPWGHEGERNFVGTEAYQVGRIRGSDGISAVNVKGTVRLLTTDGCNSIISHGKKDSDRETQFTEDDFVCTESVIADDGICQHLSGSVVGYRDGFGRVTAISLVTAGLVSCPVISMPLYSAQNLGWIKAVAF